LSSFRKKFALLQTKTEYWAPHVDSQTYEETVIHYSALFYLSSYGSAFTGGALTTPHHQVGSNNIGKPLAVRKREGRARENYRREGGVEGWSIKFRKY
jgi:hypothetical protein